MIILLVPKCVAFDFDLTLVNSSEAIKKTIVQVLENYNIQPTIQELNNCLHLPLNKIFNGWNHKIDIELAEDMYLEKYFDLCIEGAFLLPGAKVLLENLTRRQVEIVIVSAKKEKNLQKMLKFFGLDQYDSYGDVFLETKAEVLRKKECKFYVGDHPNDVLAARLANCKSIITLTGISTKGEFNEFVPDLIVENLNHLMDHLDDLLDEVVW